MSKMIERAALAIQGELGPIYGHMVPMGDCINAARAAISAMREPDPEAISEHTSAYGEALHSGEDFWKVMIEEALK